MELLAGPHCLRWLLAFSHFPFQLQRVSAFLSLSPMFDCCLSLSLPVPWRFWLSLTLSHGCLLSLTVSPIPWSCYMTLTVSHFCWRSLTVSPSTLKLLHVSYSLLWLLAFCHYLSKCHGVVACVLLSPMLASCLSMSLRSHGVTSCL